MLELHLCTLHLVALGRVINIAEMITSFTCISLSLSPFDTYLYFTPTARDDTSSEAILAGVI